MQPRESRSNRSSCLVYAAPGGRLAIWIGDVQACAFHTEGFRGDHRAKPMRSEYRQVRVRS